MLRNSQADRAGRAKCTVQCNAAKNDGGDQDAVRVASCIQGKVAAEPRLSTHTNVFVEICAIIIAIGKYRAPMTLSALPALSKARDDKYQLYCIHELSEPYQHVTAKLHYASQST
jgi:hypothetical protein